MATRSDAVATGTVQAAEDALRGFPSPFRILPFLGPAFVACVAYIDPGNFATNIAGGSKFGFTLAWVILASNLMAMLIQTLSAKLGIATQRNLPEVCRERLPRQASFFLWLQAEAIAMATYLAELSFAHPDYAQVLKHAVTPQFGGSEAVLLSVGILGATVMPHVIYLHSALTQDRLVPRNAEDAPTLLRYN